MTQSKVEEALREFILETVAEKFIERAQVQRIPRAKEVERKYPKGRVVHPETDRRLKQNRRAA